ncbi:nickel-dependent lactate racemase [candidate division KSB1 bacterium]|nr:nickel-dependent lactate racemase [candidate division KSB1 bacterium]
MGTTLKYGRGVVGLTAGVVRSSQWLSLPGFAAAGPEERVVRQAMENPIGSSPLERFVQPGEKVGVIVPDHTRKWGGDIVLPIVLEKLKSQGITDLLIIIASGTHRPTTQDEILGMVGKSIGNRYPICPHDGKDEKELEWVGMTKRGTPVWINKRIAEVDKILALGGILYHYFAGFGGGPKLMMPGVAGWQSIEKNHLLTLDESGNFRPQCGDGILDGNPVYEDIVDSLRFFKPAFLLNTILNDRGRIAAAVAGDVVLAHLKGCEIAKKMYTIPIREKADLVVVSAGGYPKDSTFIQSHKAIQHAFYAVREGGLIIALAECAEGIGSPTFMEWFEYPDLETMKCNLVKHYSINGHTALSLRNKLQKVKIILVSELDFVTVKKMGLIPANTFEEAMAVAGDFLPRHYKTYILEDGSAGVPKMVD